jgi:hypothetical protein
MTSNQRRIEADVRAILADGGDPAIYAKSLASHRGVSLEIVMAAIAAVGGTPRQMDEHTTADERLATDRRTARLYPAAARAFNHEEE